MLTKLHRLPAALRRFASSAAQASKIVSVSEHGDKAVKISWDDGMSGVYHYVWLRDNCPAEHTYHMTENSKHRLLRIRNLDVDVTPQQQSFDKTKLSIVWPEDGEANYSSEWLRTRNLCDPKVQKKRPEVYLKDIDVWNVDQFNKSTREFDFERILTDGKHLHDALVSLQKYGLVFFKNAGSDPDQLVKFKEAIGYQTLTHYGKRFEVKTQADPTNIAYTTVELELHIDLPHLEKPPEIQILHCVARSGGTGGESTFSDGFNTERIMKAECPDLHEILTRVQFEYCDEGQDAVRFDTTTRHPVFIYNDAGELKRVIFNNHMRSWFYDDVDSIPKVYKALSAFAEISRRKENQISRSLHPGDAVIFANLRVLHGREEFVTDVDSRRHLEGFYFPWDAIKSKIRLLRDVHQLPENQVSI